MTPRLEAIARYHRWYKRLLRQASIWPNGTPEFEVLLRDATIAYNAAVNEAHPEKARERA